MVDNARRGFLRARIARASLPLRPPWAVPEGDFISRCSRCGDCVAACVKSGSSLLKPGEGGYPVAAFDPASCTFCGDCVSACATSALDRAAWQRADAPWSIRAQIGERCLAHDKVVCRSCGEACPVAAIRFRLQLGGVAVPELDPDRCTGCGACLPTCPVAAIAIAGQRSEQRNEHQHGIPT